MAVGVAVGAGVGVGVGVANGLGLEVGKTKLSKWTGIALKSVIQVCVVE